MNTYKEVIDKCPDDISTTIREDFLNKNLYGRNRNFNGINDIGVDGEEVETKDIDSEDVIHRAITEN